MERLERRDPSVKLGVWVLIILSCVALAALIVLILTVHSGDKSETELIHGVTKTPTAGLTPATVICLSGTTDATTTARTSDEGSNGTQTNRKFFDEFKCKNNTKEDASARKENWNQIKNNIKNVIRKNNIYEDLAEMADITKGKWLTLVAFNYFCTEGKSVDMRGISMAKQYFNNASGWPLLKGDTSNVNWTFEKLWEIESLFKTLFLEGGGLIKMTLGLTNGAFLIKIGKPDLRLPTDILDILEYSLYKTKVATLFGAERKLIDTEIRKVFKFEKTIEELVQSRKHVNTTKLQSYEELVKIESLSYISWKKLLSFFKKYESTEVQYEVEDLDYLVTLREVIEKNNFEDVANFIFWRVADQLAPYISSDFRTNLPFHDRNDSPQDYCLETVSRHTVPIIFDKYDTSDLQTKEDEVKKMAENIRKEIINYVNSTTTSPEKEKIIEKINSISVHTVYPENLRDSNALNNYYEEFNTASNFERTTSFLDAHLSLSKWNSEDMIEKNKMFSEWMNFDDLTTPEACYSEGQKYIVIKLGLLEPPYFDRSMSSSEKYGSLGYKIAELFNKVSGDMVCAESPCNNTINVAFQALKRSELQANLKKSNSPEGRRKLQVTTSPNPQEMATELQTVVTSYHYPETLGAQATTQIPLPATSTYSEELFISSVAKAMCKTHNETQVKDVLKSIEL